MKYAAPYLYKLENMVRKGHLRRDGLVVSILILIIIFLSACTIRKLNENDGKDGDIYSTWNKTGTGFNAEEYVNDNWESKIVPDFMENSINVSEVLQSITEDSDTAIKKYGYKKDADSTEIFFKVKGIGQVLTFNDSSRIGLLEMDLDPADGAIDILIQVGPVIKRTEIRDSLDFIKFTDIGNQLQFASLSDEFNKRIIDWTLRDIDLKEAAGKGLEFYGVFSIDSENINIDKIIITPVIIKYVN